MGERLKIAVLDDYLHLSQKGYEIWAESLERPLNRALGVGQ